MEDIAVSDLKTIAREFNAAFDAALNEIDVSRRRVEEQSAKIDELNESIRIAGVTLDEEVSKHRCTEEAFTNEAVELRQTIHNMESDRDQLHHQLHEQGNELGNRIEEIRGMSSRIEELNNALEQHTAEGQQARETFEQEKDTLSRKLYELQEVFDSTDELLKAQQGEVEKRDSELTERCQQIEHLNAELAALIAASKQKEDELNLEATRRDSTIQDLNESIRDGDKLLEQRNQELLERDREISWLNEHTNKLSAEIDSQTELHTETCHTLNTKITNISAEVDSLIAIRDELVKHVKKLENLNNALHESSVSESILHKNLLDDKDRKIELLQTISGTDNETIGEQLDKAIETEDLQTALHDLETRLQEAEAENQGLFARTSVADKLETEVEQLRNALLDNSNTPSVAAPPAMQLLQSQMVVLQSALNSSRSEQENITRKLRDHSSLKLEVMELREALQNAESEIRLHARAGTHKDCQQTPDTELTATGETDQQLHTELPDITIPGSSDVRETPRLPHVSPAAPEPVERDRFISHLDQHLCSHDNTDAKYYVMYLYMDNLTNIREAIDTADSENAISEMSVIIASFCDDGDIVSRVGSCVFAILAHGKSTEEIQNIANNIRSAFENHTFDYSGESLATTASIGITIVRENDTSAVKVLSQASGASKEARSSGGNQVLVNSTLSAATTETEDHEHCEEIIRKTLDDNRIRIYYQAITSLGSNTNDHYEVLVRIVDEADRIILPGDFFSMAERTGHAMDIDYYVIENIIKMMAENRNQPMTLFVKLTGQSVADRGFPAWVVGLIKEYRIDPTQLVFEIAETILENNPGNLPRLSETLSKAGCQIAIEHYRLSTQPEALRNTHADYLKIDGSLTRDIDNRGESYRKVSEIANIAREHNCATIAEGVENQASMAVLQELGVSFAQGYYIQMPAGTRDYNFCGDGDESEYIQADRTTG